MEAVADRIDRAVAQEDIHAERLANRARLILLTLLACVALLNAGTVSREANAMNFGVLVVGFAYGFAVFLRIRGRGYFPAMKYITSCFDIALVSALLFLYTSIEIPSVALKNYAFLVVFPLIALTAFRYDRTLTLVAGGLAVALYIALVATLAFRGVVVFSAGGYADELFTQNVTYVGQGTKVLILTGYVLLLAYLAGYSRRLFVQLVTDESNERSQKEAMERELEIASHVQLQLQPRLFPHLPGLEMFGAVEQGRFVGGDYCDFLPAGDRGLLLVMADVSGKGVPAALIMSEVRATIHLLAPTRPALEVLAARLNTLLHLSTRRKDFVTFFAAEIDPSRGTLRYINAGHPPPLLLAGGELRSLSRRSLPLGLFDPLPDLAPATESFPSGGVLVAYTDGILERRDAGGELYGADRLAAYARGRLHLDAQPFVAGLMKEVMDFGRGRTLDDDVGLAVVRALPSR